MQYATVAEAINAIPDGTTRQALMGLLQYMGAQFNTHTHLCGGDGVFSSTPSGVVGKELDSTAAQAFPE
jgi:hypothetical protein